MEERFELKDKNLRKSKKTKENIFKDKKNEKLHLSDFKFDHVIKINKNQTNKTHCQENFFKNELNAKNKSNFSFKSSSNKKKKYHLQNLKKNLKKLNPKHQKIKMKKEKNVLNKNEMNNSELASIFRNNKILQSRFLKNLDLISDKKIERKNNLFSQNFSSNDKHIWRNGFNKKLFEKDLQKNKKKIQIVTKKKFNEKFEYDRNFCEAKLKKKMKQKKSSSNAQKVNKRKSGKKEILNSINKDKYQYSMRESSRSFQKSIEKITSNKKNDEYMLNKYISDAISYERNQENKLIYGTCNLLKSIESSINLEELKKNEVNLCNDAKDKYSQTKKKKKFYSKISKIKNPKKNNLQFFQKFKTQLEISTKKEKPSFNSEIYERIIDKNECSSLKKKIKKKNCFDSNEKELSIERGRSSFSPIASEEYLFRKNSISQDKNLNSEKNLKMMFHSQNIKTKTKTNKIDLLEILKKNEEFQSFSEKIQYTILSLIRTERKNKQIKI